MQSRPILATLLVIAACASVWQVLVSAAGQLPPSRYLFTWVGDEGREDSDFLAVIDLARHGGRYGTIVATSPIGERGLWPHHTEHELGASRMLFANGFSSNQPACSTCRIRCVRRSSSGSTVSAA